MSKAIHSLSLNFAHQDLRHCSFRDRPLQGADFTGADLRGCDFSGAQLQGATFAQARLGATGRSRTTALIAALVMAGLIFHGVSQLVFGVLGVVREESAWVYVIALNVSLAISGLSAGLRPWFRTQTWIHRGLALISAAISGALLGFFYGGSAANQNPQVAVISAVIGGCVGAIWGWRVRVGPRAVALAVAGTIATYAMTFLAGTTATTFLTTAHLLNGLLWSGLTLAYLGLTLSTLTTSWTELRHAMGTSFRGANLTPTKFDPGSLPSVLR